MDCRVLPLVGAVGLAALAVPCMPIASVAQAPLSEQRAAAVRNYLIAQFGIAADRLSAKGYGKSQPLDPEHPEDGVNRRVQVINANAASN
jgi:hypothetical protein